MNDDQPGTAPGAGGQDEASLRRKLATLKVEHEDLDASITALRAVAHPDQLRIARLKKKKLGLRDQIVRLEDALFPDIIA